jgi:hypothetical protein
LSTTKGPGLSHYNTTRPLYPPPSDRRYTDDLWCVLSEPIEEGVSSQKTRIGDLGVGIIGLVLVKQRIPSPLWCITYRPELSASLAVGVVTIVSGLVGDHR